MGVEIIFIYCIGIEINFWYGGRDQLLGIDRTF